jgi:hypothetical protein
MASGSTVHNHAPLDFRCSRQASAEQFQQCAEISAAPQSPPWSVRRDDIAHSDCRDSRHLGTTSIAPVEKTAGSHGFLPPIHCKSVPGVISSSPCL